ncbi:hypothetical protein SE17_12245 [Kouleothrix aurantiaca]|uniref:Uncharacterized protein n=1 Tax=Kouleothrix aurantiaca TaxID=186479 RepID=A0A0P9FIP6_9CHLR|nr:hypothetical protein SE17_12245 [Kouleothrix aurantiaca]
MNYPTLNDVIAANERRAAAGQPLIAYYATREEFNAATDLVLAAFDLPSAYRRYLQTVGCTGWCLVTLLANAAAKVQPERAAEFYAAKVILLNVAIGHVRMGLGEWWAAPHPYGDYADTVVYIESPFARFAFHCKKSDPMLAGLLDTHPMSDRGWSGLSLQPYALELVQGFVNGPETAAEIIASIQAQESGTREIAPRPATIDLSMNR